MRKENRERTEQSQWLQQRRQRQLDLARTRTPPKTPSPSSTAIGAREYVKEGKISTSPFRELEKFVTIARGTRQTCPTIVLTVLAKSGDFATYYLAYFTTRSPSATFPSVSLSFSLSISLSLFLYPRPRPLPPPRLPI